jgi:formylglycine-generating enzyme required for sulfatase activity
MHGLIWEWVLDFNIRTSSDGRRTDEAFVCGGSSLRGSDKYDYGAYMRFAFRGSLQGNYTTANLGFRCARDVVVKGASGAQGAKTKSEAP